MRQLFELRVARLDGAERGEVLAGPAGAAWRLFSGEAAGALADDASFAVLHGLYWLVVNLAVGRPLLVAVDDAHWADESSLRWLAYMTARVEGLAVGLLVTVRPGEPSYEEPPLVTVRREAGAVVRPRLLTQAAVTAIVRDRAGGAVSGELCAAVKRVSGGNPFYVGEALRAVELESEGLAGLDPDAVVLGGVEAVRRYVTVRVRRLGREALGFAQAVAVLGDGCELRHAAAVAGVGMEEALNLAVGLVRLEVLQSDQPPAFLHPIVRQAVDASLGSDERDAAHRLAARLLHEDGAPPGRVAAHLVHLRPAGDLWVLARLREAAGAATESGAPQAAAELMARALAEPPPPDQRVECLREAARAEATAGRETACALLEQALSLADDPGQRAEIALELAEVHSDLFQWVEAFDVAERALDELGDGDGALAARLEGALVVAGLLDARRAARVVPVLERLSARPRPGIAAEAVAVARGEAMVLAGRPVDETAAPLEEALAGASVHAENWNIRSVLLWTLVVCESFDAVEKALGPMLAEVHRSGSARGLVAAYTTLGLLKLRLGALPEGDAAARVALRVLREGDFVSGLPFATMVLADVAVEAGELQEAQELLALLPQEGWPPGVGTVLILAARGRLRLAQGRPLEALSDFKTCLEMYSPEVWGMEVRDFGFLHARSGAALALLALGEQHRAREFARAELEDVRAAGGRRALGIASRVAGLAEGGPRGLELLRESVAVLAGSPALLERARSLGELGAALR
ncbi:MAG TPA: hypothetical protein VED41_03775, partial [Solirubrobacteraceae bacterium]|nr:hypothetical protein [Solirubrobacteraceae bacterium]